MSEMPDLSKIVNLIMENPSLIAEISALAKKNDESLQQTVSVTEKEEKEDTASVSASTLPTVTRSEKRQRLLSAMKPYLKDERSRAIDSMLSIVEILDMIRSK